jgi:hypothetical protein
MTIKEKATTAPPKTRTAPVTPASTKTRAEAVNAILCNVEARLSGENVKATLGDYIRLIQLSKEMTDEPKADIKVTWIEEPDLPPIEE